MTPDARLLVALSGRDEDAALLRYANHIAALSRSVSLLSADCRGGLGETSDGLESASGAEDEEDGPMLSGPRTVEAVDVSPNRALERLLGLAGVAGSGAIVVGEGFGRRCLRKLIQRAPCSVWFVPDGAVPRFDRLLVPVDFSVRAADCLRAATTLARLGNARECVALHVYFNDSPLANAEQNRAIRARLTETYTRFERPIDLLGVPVRSLFREGSIVCDAIHRTAAEQEADLIVLATRGRTWLGGLLHESLAEQTLRDCRMPLLVLKHFGARLGLLRLLRDPDVVRGAAVRFN